MKTIALKNPQPKRGGRLASYLDRARRTWYTFLAFMTTAVSSTSPTLCANATMASIFQSIANIIYDIALYTGLGILLFALVSWILAMKDENAEGQSRAIRTAIVGAALVCFRTIGAPIINGLMGG